MSATVHVGDCREVLARMDAGIFHACVTDGPYGLSEHDTADVIACLQAWLEGREYEPKKRGFMGKAWDGWVPGPTYWREVYRVLKPGGHLVAFAGTRTSDLMGIAIRLAGFEVRDTLEWLYGSGFPKSHNLDGEWDGYGTALKPAYEPIILARKPLVGTVAANVQAHGCGALNIDGCRVGTETRFNTSASRNEIYGQFQGAERDGRECIGRWPANVLLGCACEHGHEPDCAVAMLDAQSGETGAFAPVRGTEPSAVVAGVYSARDRCVGAFHGDFGGASRFFQTSKLSEAERWSGLANCAAESFNLGSDVSASALANVVALETAGLALSRASYRAPSTTVTGRDFALLCESVTTLIRSIERRCLLGLPLERLEVSNVRVRAAAHPTPTAITTITASLSTSGGSAVDVTFDITARSAEAGAPACAERFNYTAKATRAEREAGLEHRKRRVVHDGRHTPIDNPYLRAETQRANTHPTVKPVALMRWLVRLVGGKRGSLVLDPFMGSGTTGIACALEGFEFVGIDLDPEHVEIARARILAASEQAGTATPEQVAEVQDRQGPVQLGLLGEAS